MRKLGQNLLARFPHGCYEHRSTGLAPALHPSVNRSLSIVVTSSGSDRADDLRRLVLSVGEQSIRELELIFVGENSQETLDYVERLARDHGIRSRCVMNFGQKGLAQARNLGVQLSTSLYVAFIDDDVILPSHWAASILERLRDSDIIGVTGPAFPYWDSRKIEWLPKGFYWLISCSEWFDVRELAEVRSAQGMNMAFKREAFEKAGLFLGRTGYHKPIAEDLEFSLRVRRTTRKKIVCDPKAYVFHRVREYRLKWRYVVARSHHIGVSRYVAKKICEGGLDRERQFVLRTLRSFPFCRLRGIRDMANLACLVLVVFLCMLFGYLNASIVSRSEIGLLLNDISRASATSHSSSV